MAMFIQHNGLVHTAAVPSERHTRVVYSPHDGALAKFFLYSTRPLGICQYGNR